MQATSSLPASAHLLDRLHIRDLDLRNRIVVSPMCQYSSTDGFANEWHLVHLGSRAVGGAGLIIFEASAVEPRGRITDWDLGIYQDEHIEYLSRIVRFIEQQGSVAGIQLAHAGRKASTLKPWEGGGHIPPIEEHGWQTVAPSAVPFNVDDTVPHELTRDDIKHIVHCFAVATDRALRAGFRVIEIHAAHGYLIHQFLSPLSNRRSDEYGGSFENRIRFALEVVNAVRSRWPSEFPLFMRISATDWHADGWSPADSVKLAKAVHPLGVDLIDCSSGGLVGGVRIPVGPGYQVEFAERIRREAKIMTGAVGMITSPEQADTILRTGQADLVIMARAMLRDPYWALHAGATPPPQYERAYPKK